MYGETCAMTQLEWQKRGNAKHSRAGHGNEDCQQQSRNGNVSSLVKRPPGIDTRELSGRQ
jgi:hypothetical protein